jgi:hypothetical protein
LVPGRFNHKAVDRAEAERDDRCFRFDDGEEIRRSEVG